MRGLEGLVYKVERKRNLIDGSEVDPGRARPLTGATAEVRGHAQMKQHGSG